MAKEKQEKQEKTKKAVKCKSREELMAAINKEFGDGSVISIASGPILNIAAISTGSPTLDCALGVGGVPKGRITEIFGPESSGKTTLCLHIVKSAQQAGGVAAFVDAEHGLDPAWASKIGVNMQDLLISQPSSGEEALEIVEMMVASSQVDVIIVDSVAALIPQTEIDGEMGAQQMGAQARLMSQAMRKLIGIVGKSDCAVVFVNQIRNKIGIMFGSNETTTGGNALKFYSSVRMDIRRVESIKVDDEAVGNKVKVKVIKNKVAPPFCTAEFNIFFGKNGYPYGIDYAGSLVDAGIEAGVIEKSGSWVNFGDAKLGLGMAAACKFVRENKDVGVEIDKQIKAKQRAINPVMEPQNEAVETETEEA